MSSAPQGVAACLFFALWGEVQVQRQQRHGNDSANILAATTLY